MNSMMNIDVNSGINDTLEEADCNIYEARRLDDYLSPTQNELTTEDIEHLKHWTKDQHQICLTQYLVEIKNCVTTHLKRQLPCLINKNDFLGQFDEQLEKVQGSFDDILMSRDLTAGEVIVLLDDISNLYKTAYWIKAEIEAQHQIASMNRDLLEEYKDGE